MSSENRYTAGDVIAAIDGSFGIKTTIAERLGCVRGTVNNYIDRYPTVRRAYEDERGRLIDTAQSKLVERLEQGEDWAIKYTLSTLGKNEGFVERSEVTGADGGAVPLEVRFVQRGDDRAV